MLTKGKNYFIEFKNRNHKALQREKLKLFEKNYASIITLISNHLEDLNNIRNNYIYILVYDRVEKQQFEEKPWEWFAADLNDKAKEADFGLGKFKEQYFADVRTIGKEAFETFLDKLTVE